MLSDSQSDVDRVYAEGRWEALCANVALYPHIVGIDFDKRAESLRDVEVAFSTWGMPELVDAHLDRMPLLSALFSRPVRCCLLHSLFSLATLRW